MFIEQPLLLSKYNAIASQTPEERALGKVYKVSSTRLGTQKVLSKHWISPKVS